MKKSVLIVTGLALFTIVLAQTKNPPAKKTTTQAKPAPAQAKPAAAGTLQATIAEGKKVYMQTCVSCHQLDGGGVQNMTPPLIKTSYVLGDKIKLAGIVLNGMSNVEIDEESYHNVMPPMNYLTDKQIADVLTYVRNSFGNKASAVTEKEVKAARVKK
ncbi:MAG: cytochrome c [Chitinophagaceae bacterium]